MKIMLADPSHFNQEDWDLSDADKKRIEKLIKEGKILNIGSPEDVLTRDLLKEAFDVGVDIRKDETGGTYINYES